VTTDEARNKIDDLRKDDDRHRGQLDVLLRETRRKKAGWTEDEIEYWLHPALHLMLGGLSNLSSRMTNLEDMVLRAMEGTDKPSEGWSSE